MKFKFYIGTKVLFGKGCIKENKSEFLRFGRKAFIVTGRNSAKLSGALVDVEQVLREQGIDYVIYDKVENNPSLENVKDGGIKASACNADFIIGIGGGSPLDAAKAIAVLAVNDIEPERLFSNTFDNKPLPVIAIPTTAGTGSEVTPYSILTRKDISTKMSFGNEDLFPKIAFADPRYTENLSYDVTVDTAVDAFCHAMEGYLNRRSTPASDILAEEAIKIFGQCLGALLENNIDIDIREKLMYVAMLGGMVISHTGTTILHGMGYSLTYFKGITHGRANGLLIREYLRFNNEAAEQKIDNILKFLRLNSIDELGIIMDSILKCNVVFSTEELREYASLTVNKKSTSNNIRNVSEQDLFEILKRSLRNIYEMNDKRQ